MRQHDCIFCNLEALDLIAENALAFAIRDKFPVKPLHTLIIPRRHAAHIFETSVEEREAIHVRVANSTYTPRNTNWSPGRRSCAAASPRQSGRPIAMRFIPPSLLRLTKPEFYRAERCVYFSHHDSERQEDGSRHAFHSIPFNQGAINRQILRHHHLRCPQLQGTCPGTLPERFTAIGIAKNPVQPLGHVFGIKGPRQISSFSVCHCITKTSAIKGNDGTATGLRFGCCLWQVFLAGWNHHHVSCVV